MKKILIVLTACLILGAVAFAEGYDFRNTNWGDSIEKIKNVETAEFLDQANLSNGRTRLRYSATIEDYKTAIVYIFDKDNRLTNAVYMLEKSVSSAAGYTLMVQKFKDLLTEKYGKPINESISLISIAITWKVPDTIISLEYNKVSGSNFSNLAYIQYKPSQTVGQDL